MMMRSLVFAFCCAAAGPVPAQITPTDIDLRTAYCVRVVASELAGIQQLLGGAQEKSPLNDAIQKSLNERTNVLNRLRSYLVPKLASLNPDALIAAAARADADLQERSLFADTCTKKCSEFVKDGKPTQRWPACIEECTASPLFTRLSACHSPDWLPF